MCTTEIQRERVLLVFVGLVVLAPVLVLEGLEGLVPVGLELELELELKAD